jgi:AraC-like DNA-binding protein
MATVIHASDIGNFPIVSTPLPMAPGISTHSVPVFFHPLFGGIRFNQIVTPYLNATDVAWSMKENVELHEIDSSETININFLIRGKLDTRFRGLRNDLQMRPGRHNLVYAPEGKDVHWLPAGQTIEMFHISLDRHYFANCIGTGDAWGEQIVRDIEHKRPLIGKEAIMESTPQMMGLIENIRHNHASGPMRNLLIQSQILELLALQIDQFRTTLPLHEHIRYDEAEKLYNLKSYLDANFLTELSLTQLSRVCLLNEFKVKKGFKLLFGTTVFSYLRKLRMDYAGNMLSDTSRSVDEVADMLGYEHAQHFSIAFKKYMGVSPSHFQNKGRLK